MSTDLRNAYATLARLRADHLEERRLLEDTAAYAGMLAYAAVLVTDVELPKYSGIELAELPQAVVASLAALAPPGPQGNPLDIGGDAPVQRYVDVLTALDGAAADSATLFIHAPSALVASDDIAQALLPLAEDGDDTDS